MMSLRSAEKRSSDTVMCTVKQEPCEDDQETDMKEDECNSQFEVNQGVSVDFGKRALMPHLVIGPDLLQRPTTSSVSANLTVARMAPAATPDQIFALLNFLDQHKQLAQGKLRGANARDRAKKLWLSITTKLNAMGPPKSVEQWQRVWADKKHLTKKNYISASRRCAANGDGSSPKFSQTEQMVLSIIAEDLTAPAPCPQPPDESSLDEDQSLADIATNGKVKYEDTTEVYTRPSQPRKGIRRRLIHDTSIRTKLMKLEEQRLKLDEDRNSELRGLRIAVTRLTGVLEQFLSRNEGNSN